MNALLDLGLLDGPVVIAVYTAAALVVVLLIVRGARQGRVTWLAVAGGAAATGAVLGALLTWLLADRLDLFGVHLSLVVRLWIAAGFAGIGVAIASIWRPAARSEHKPQPPRKRPPRRLSIARTLSALAAIALFAGTTALAVNIDFGQYPTVRSALGLSAFAGIPLPQLAATTVPDDPADTTGSPEGAGARALATWTPPADMPATGSVSSVSIPAAASGFDARDAVVYLPPAALTAHPPRLPVLIVMSGQPGSPDDPLLADHLRDDLDAFAAAHHGLAPIVVSPDQLGAPDRNPMCVDSPLGDSATYLTVDVPAWIRSHLPVLPGPHYWGVAGLSQGGTCSIQLGAGRPDLFGALIDASGEEYPKLGDEETTIAKGFGGDPAAYAAAHPAALLAAHAPYPDTVAVFGAGADDSAYLPGVERLSHAAQAAGMHVTFVEVPGSGHDATAWSGVFAQGLPLVAQHWGLDR